MCFKEEAILKDVKQFGSDNNEETHLLSRLKGP